MNRTYDEPETETDVMAAAFRTIRRYGMTIITATQHMDVNGYVKTDPRMPERGCAATWGSMACAVRR
jgi:hypothetical protein